MATKKDDGADLERLRLPVTPRMKKEIERAVYGAPGVEPRIGFNELAAAAGLQPNGLRRILGRATDQTEESRPTSDRLRDLCVALEMPPSFCLPLDDDEAALIKALHEVRASGGDAQAFVEAVQGFAKVEASRGRARQPAAFGTLPPVPAPKSTPRPAAVKPRSSSDNTRK